MRLRVKYSILLMYIEVLALAEPAYIAKVSPVVHRAWQAMLILCCFLVAIETFRERQSWQVLITGAFAILVYGCILGSTIFHQGEVVTAIVKLITFPYGFFLSARCMRKDAPGYLRVLKNVMFACVAINLLSIVFFRDGLYYVELANGSLDHRYWFLGFKNGIGKTCIICIAVSALSDMVSKTRWHIFTLLSIAIGFASVFLIRSSSGIVGVTLVTGLLLLVRFKFFTVLFTARNLAIVAVTVLVMVLAGQALMNSASMQFLVRNLLQRDMTFSRRIYIWANVIEIIKNNLFFGVGLKTGTDNASMIGVTVHASDAHNYYLEFLMEGGLITGVLMGIFLYRVVKALNDERDKSSAQIATCALFALMIVFISENCNNEFLWTFYGLCSSIAYCEPKTEKRVAYGAMPDRNISYNGLLYRGRYKTTPQ